MSSRSGRVDTLSYWAGTDRAQPKTILRLDGSEYLGRVFEWVEAAIPRMEELTIYAFGTPASPIRPSLQEVIEKDSECGVVIYFGHRILGDDSDPVWDTVNMIRSLERARRAVGSRLGLKELPPLVPLSAEERAWLEVHGEPKVRAQGATVEFADKRLPDRPPVPEVFGDFDVWRLFVGGESDPFRGFKRRYRALGKAKKRHAANAVRECIDAWQEAMSDASGESCWSDGEAIHAADLLFGGRQLWEAALADPVGLGDVWPADGDGEILLDLVEWGVT